jgi:hypothetical protein
MCFYIDNCVRRKEHSKIKSIKPVLMLAMIVLIVSRDSEYVKQICDVCGDICEACANECERHTDMDHYQRCARVCRRCAKECRKM